MSTLSSTLASNRPATFASIAKSAGVKLSPNTAYIHVDRTTGLPNSVESQVTHATQPLALPMSVTANTVTKATNRAVTNVRAIGDILRQRPLLGLAIAAAVVVGAAVIVRAITRYRRKCSSNKDCASAMWHRNTCYRGKCETIISAASGVANQLFDYAGDALSEEAHNTHVPAVHPVVHTPSHPNVVDLALQDMLVATTAPAPALVPSPSVATAAVVATAPAPVVTVDAVSDTPAARGFIQSIFGS